MEAFDHRTGLGAIVEGFFFENQLKHIVVVFQVELMIKVLTLFFAIIEYFMADLLATTTEVFLNMVGVDEKQNSSHFILVKHRSFFSLVCC